MIWNVHVTVNGNGVLNYTRHTPDGSSQESDEYMQNWIDFSAIPNVHHHLVKIEFYPLNAFLIADTFGTPIVAEDSVRFIVEEEKLEVTNTTYSIHANQELYVTAYFEEDPKWHLEAITDTPHTSVYVSLNDQYDPFETVIWARPFPNYTFYAWSDGSTENPRTVYVDQNRILVATYKKTPSTDGIYQYSCYIKDQLALRDLPKVFVRVKTFDISVDLMTNANSTINVYDLPDNVEPGDVLALYDPKGKTIYNGVIKSIEIVDEKANEKKIICSQMQSFYKGQWIYEKGETPPSSYDNSWFFEKYGEIGSTYPHMDDVDALSPTSTSTYNDNNTSGINIGDNYTARATTYVWCSKPTIVNASVLTDDNGAVYLNDQLLCDTDTGVETMVELQLVKGMNKLNVLYTEKTGSDGWNVYLNYLSFPAYDSSKKYEVGDYVGYSEAIYQCKTAITTPEKWTGSHWNKITTKLRITLLPDVLGLNSTKATDIVLEKSLKNILDYYASGHIVGSDFVDPLIAQRLSGFTVRYEASNIGINLPTNPVGEVMDFEEFIYYLYEHYGIIFEFEMNVFAEEGTDTDNFVTIKVPKYEKISVGDNVYAITNMNPVTTVEETNRLVIFAGDNVTYRATWVATETEKHEAKSDDISRMRSVNTEIVFSDDPIADIVANSLPDQMYNHQISFTLILKNFVYQFDQFKLGAGLDIYTQKEYYDSVLTGYEISKDENYNIESVDLICGKVRSKLTQLLTLKKI